MPHLGSTTPIEVLNLDFGYRSEDEIFCRFSWQVQEGEWCAVVGPSGCGKTTLLHLLAGLRQARKGQVLDRGQPIVRPRASTGLILQDFGLLPWAKVRDNVALGLRMRGVPEHQCNETVASWLQRLGIYEQRNQYPSQLSGGQRQRTAIARTLALAPDLLLMDEPFGSLDAFTREDLQNLAAELARERARTCVIVTHDVEEAVFLGDRILVLGHPPVSYGAILDNPLARQPNYREDPEFYRKCSEVRACAIAAQRGPEVHVAVASASAPRPAESSAAGSRPLGNGS